MENQQEIGESGPLTVGKDAWAQWVSGGLRSEGGGTHLEAREVSKEEGPSWTRENVPSLLQKQLVEGTLTHWDILEDNLGLFRETGSPCWPSVTQVEGRWKGHQYVLVKKAKNEETPNTSCHFSKETHKSYVSYKDSNIDCRFSQTLGIAG